MKNQSQNTPYYSATFAFAFLALVSLTGSSGLAQLSDAPYCRDTDGGRNYYKAGTATEGDAGLTDACLPDGSIREYFCTTTGKRNVTLTSCPIGFRCQEGACVSGTIPSSAADETVVSGSSTEPVGCTDSDGGRFPSIKGTTIDEKGERADSCISKTAVKEYYCSGVRMRSATVICKRGSVCRDGACVKR